MNKCSAHALLCTFLVVILAQTSWGQTPKPAATPTTQPTTSMQEQYDKLHGIKPKTTPQKPEKSKPKTAQKPTKPVAAPNAEVAKQPKASINDEGGFKFKVGLRGGANYATVTAPKALTSAKYESILGYHGGLILSFGGKMFSVQPEILYSQSGSKVSGTLGSSAVTAETVINNITVPVLLKFAFGSSKFNFFVNGGGYGSYALNGNTKITSASGTLNNKVEFTDNKGRIEYGAVGGAGISLGLGAAQLLLEGRYYYGLGNNSGLDNNSNSFARNIQGSIGILFPLGGK